MSRLLVVATGPVAADELASELARRGGDGGPAKVRLVAPAVVSSPLRHASGDIDEGVEDAIGRIEAAIRRLEDRGIELESCSIGDSDPLLAIGDELRKAPADEILLVTRTEDEAAWMEDGLFDRVREEVSQPVTHIAVSGSNGRSGEIVEQSGPGRDRPEAAEVSTPSKNMPRFTARDMLGIAIALIGSVALFALASGCIDEPADTRGTACTAQLLIAGVTGLINIAHVVGMLLFSSLGYRGIAERFFATFSAIGTPAAIAAVLVIGLTE